MTELLGSGGRKGMVAADGLRPLLNIPEPEAVGDSKVGWLQTQCEAALPKQALGPEPRKPQKGYLKPEAP